MSIHNVLQSSQNLLKRLVFNNLCLPNSFWLKPTDMCNKRLARITNWPLPVRRQHQEQPDAWSLDHAWDCACEKISCQLIHLFATLWAGSLEIVCPWHRSAVRGEGLGEGWSGGPCTTCSFGGSAQRGAAILFMPLATRFHASFRGWA